MALPGAWRRGLAAERGPQAAVPAADTGLGGARRLRDSRRPPPAPASTGRNLDRTSSEQDRETDESAQPKTQKTSHAGQRSRPCVSPFPRWLRVWGGGARCRHPGGGSVELGVHDARVPSQGRTQPACGHRIQATALGEVPWFPVHPVATPWTGRAGPHAGEANSDLAPGRGGSGGWASGKFKGPVGRG